VHVRDIVKLIHSKNFLTVFSFEKSLVLLKVQIFILVCDAVV